VALLLAAAITPILVMWWLLANVQLF
jgi:hypothetical protein